MKIKNIEKYRKFWMIKQQAIQLVVIFRYY